MRNIGEQCSARLALRRYRLYLEYIWLLKFDNVGVGPTQSKRWVPPSRGGTHPIKRWVPPVGPTRGSHPYLILLNYSNQFLIQIQIHRVLGQSSATVTHQIKTNSTGFWVCIISKKRKLTGLTEDIACEMTRGGTHPKLILENYSNFLFCKNQIETSQELLSDDVL